MNSLKEYFLREFNVQLLPFSKDEKGWEQLIDVVAHLAREIPVDTLLESQQKTDMEELLK